MIELAIGIAGALLALWFVLRALRRRRVDDRDWLPAELRAARLVYAERLFRSSGSPVVSAKVDRAYRDHAGVLVLVELKTRSIDKAYMSDVIELSAQRYALMAQTCEPVATHGYVLVERAGTSSRHCIRVPLLGSPRVEQLAQLHADLIEGRVESRGPWSTGVCAECAFRSACWPASRSSVARR